jgi:hypothetical protein
LRVTLDDNTQYRGPLRSFTAEQVDQRDIALGGAPILRLKPGDDPTTGWEEMKPFDAVILDGSHIRSIAVQFLDADGRSLQAQSPKQRESWLPRFNVRERISERRSRQGEGSTTTPSRRCVLDRHHDKGPAQVKLSGGPPRAGPGIWPPPARDVRVLAAHLSRAGCAGGAWRRGLQRRRPTSDHDLLDSCRGYGG